MHNCLSSCKMKLYILCALLATVLPAVITGEEEKAQVDSAVVADDASNDLGVVAESLSLDDANRIARTLYASKHLGYRSHGNKLARRHNRHRVKNSYGLSGYGLLGHVKGALYGKLAGHKNRRHRKHHRLGRHKGLRHGKHGYGHHGYVNNGYGHTGYDGIGCGHAGCSHTGYDGIGCGHAGCGHTGYGHTGYGHTGYDGIGCGHAGCGTGYDNVGYGAEYSSIGYDGVSSYHNDYHGNSYDEIDGYGGYGVDAGYGGYGVSGHNSYGNNNYDDGYTNDYNDHYSVSNYENSYSAGSGSAESYITY